jgi:hypothetical protein
MRMDFEERMQMAYSGHTHIGMPSCTETDEKHEQHIVVQEKHNTNQFETI